MEYFIFNEFCLSNVNEYNGGGFKCNGIVNYQVAFGFWNYRQEEKKMTLVEDRVVE